MLLIILGVILVALIFAPSLWVRYVMHKYNKPIDDMPGDGKELAEHLIERFALTDVMVEEGGVDMNHYDSSNKTVRLSPELFTGKTLTAIAVAAHEVGHAIQHNRRERLILWREKMLPKIQWMERISAVGLMLVPAIGAATRLPHLVLLTVALIVMMMAGRIIFHLVTLPIEWDASFGKALPILNAGYVPTHLQPAIKQVLLAAALTYVAAALADMLRFWRWIRFLR